MEVRGVGVKNPRSYAANSAGVQSMHRDAIWSGVNAVCVNAIEVYMIKEIFVVGG
jgi:hypothetical protein